MWTFPYLSGHFPFSVSLVVTEIFDAGLIGEQTLSTLHHAWKHLLRTSNTAVKVCKRIIVLIETIISGHI